MANKKFNNNAIVLSAALLLFISPTVTPSRPCCDRTDRTYLGSLTQEDEHIAEAPVDFFSLQVTEGQVIKIYFGQQDSSRLSCFQLYIYPPDARQIIADGQYGAECSFAVSSSGQLYLAATTFCHSGTTGDYYLEIDGTQEPLIEIHAAAFMRATQPDRRWLVQTNQTTWGNVPPPDAIQQCSSLNFNPGYLEYLILSLINAERKNKNLPVLEYHYTLNGAARQHSEEMAQLNYFSHTSPVSKYKTIKKRIVKVFYYQGKKFYENIGMVKKNVKNAEWNFSYQSVADELFKSWMTESQNRHNILRKDIDYLGTGCACAVDGDTVIFYFTGNFGGM
jgi:uncharacterized protein YkwD